MAYLYPYGDTQQLNLDWLIEQWNEVKSQIDGSLQAEIDRVEAAITDLLTARDEAVAAQTAAQASAQAAAGSASTASGAASTATAQAQAAAGSAATAGAHASDAQGYAATAQQEAQAANNSAGAAAISANTANGAKQDAQTYAQQASGSAQNAQGSAVAAQQQFNLADAARQAAQGYASDAADSAQDAQDILDSIPEDYSDLSNDVSELQTAISFDYVYPNLQILFASINQNTGVVTTNAKCRTVWFPILPNTDYIIEKQAGGRFSVGESATTISTGTTLTNIIVDNTATRITYHTSQNAGYMAVFCFYENTDTNITASKMCASVKVSQHITKTNIYEEKYILQPYTIYNNGILPYSVFGKFPEGNLQSVAYLNNTIYVIKEGAITYYSKTGVPITENYAQLAHPHYAEVDGQNILITATDDTEQRSLFIYDTETSQLTKSFSLNVNMVSASKVSNTQYKIIAWETNGNNLKFYDYDTSTSTLTEIGEYVLSKGFYQGGCRFNNLYYMLSNNATGASGEINIVEIVDGNSFNKVGEITVLGAGECEGFFVFLENNNLFAYTVSNTTKRIIKIKI